MTSRAGALLLCCLALAALGGPAAVSGAGPTKTAALPILGVDPLPQGVVLENHDCALQHWLERGFRGAVLLHVDTHDDLRPVSADNLATLKALLDRGDIKGMARKGCGGRAGLFNEGNFLSAAVALGVVREVVWVLPFRFLDDEAAAVKLVKYLEEAGFSRADRESFRLVDGWYRGAVRGTPVTLCEQERLPKIAEPVLLSFDADFIPFAAAARGRTPLGEVRALFLALREARYEVRDAVLSHSVQGGFLPLELRWVADAVQETLRDPAIASAGRPPERWENLQLLGLLREQGQPAEPRLMSMALALVEKQPHDPALLYYAALGTAAHGGDAALRYAEEACKQDPAYCVGLRALGLEYFARRDLDVGLQFFAAADRLLPGLALGQFERGLALLDAGRTPEALAVFEEIVVREGALPIGLLIGGVQVAVGDRAAARQAYDRFLAALGRAPSFVVPDEEVAAAVRRAAAFYREEGLAAQAQALEDDPRLRWPRAAERP